MEQLLINIIYSILGCQAFKDLVPG